MRGEAWSVSVETFEDLWHGGPERQGDLAELDDVEPALARLVLADERLWLIKCSRHLYLRQAGLVSQLAKDAAKTLVRG